jgi:parallel beta-helix repeat protein
MSWATAANNIQDAVGAASVAGALVLVTNGVYQTSGLAVREVETANRVAVTKPLAQRSVNGAGVTVIQGKGGMQFDSGVRCVYLANGAALMGFTLTNGTGSPGGGVWCESHSAVVSDCVLTGNSGGISGGGASGGTLNNCMLNDNSAFLLGQGGGGASFCTLNKCTLTGNSADGNRGGGGDFLHAEQLHRLL